VSQRGTTGAALSTGAARTLLQLSASHGGVAIDPDDDTLYVSDTDNHRVLRIDPSGAVRVVAGTGKAGRGGNGPATSIALSSPRGLVLDDDKRLYVADGNNDLVRVLRQDGTLVIFAGGPLHQTDPDDGVVATFAALDGPGALVIGPASADGADIAGVTGHLFIVDEGHQRIRRVAMSAPGVPGVIDSVVVGSSCSSATGLCVSSLTQAGLAFDHGGRLYFTGLVGNAGGCPAPDPNGAYAFRREPDGTLTAIAGGLTTVASGPALGTRLLRPSGLAVDVAGNLFIVEHDGHAVRRVDVFGAMTTVLGDGTAGFVDDVVGTAARLSSPSAVALSTGGDLYVVDGGNERVRVLAGAGSSAPETATLARVDGDGQSTAIGQLVTTPLRVRVARGGGAGVVGLPVRFAAEDPGDALALTTVTMSATGEASTTVRLGRGVGTHRIFATVATWLESRPVLPADGNPLRFTLTATCPPAGSAVVVGNIAGVSGTVPGTGDFRSLPATSARYRFSRSHLALADDGTLLVTDTDNDRVVAIDSTGAQSTFAGTGVSGTADNVAATQGQFVRPQGIVIDGAGNVYVSDYDGNDGRIRRVDVGGTITTIAGGAADSPGHGDGGPGTGAHLRDPRALAIGPDGALYVVDAGLHNVRRFELSGAFVTTTLVADGGSCSTATGLRHSNLDNTGLAWDASGRLYFFGGTGNAGGCPSPVLNVRTLYRREPDGRLTSVAAGSNPADGVAGTQILLNDPSSLAFDEDGGLVYSDAGSHRIGKITGAVDVVAGTATGTAGTVTTLVGVNGQSGFATLAAPGAARLQTPRGLVVDPPNGDLYWLEDGPHAVRQLVR